MLKFCAMPNSHSEENSSHEQVLISKESRWDKFDELVGLKPYNKFAEILVYKLGHKIQNG